MKLRRMLRKFRPRPLQGEGERPVGNVDAWAAATGTQKADPMGGGMPGTAPPGWVPPADEGRPRH